MQRTDPASKIFVCRGLHAKSCIDLPGEDVQLCVKRSVARCSAPKCLNNSGKFGAVSHMDDVPGKGALHLRSYKCVSRRSIAESSAPKRLNTLHACSGQSVPKLLEPSFGKWCAGAC